MAGSPQTTPPAGPAQRPIITRRRLAPLLALALTATVLVLAPPGRLPRSLYLLTGEEDTFEGIKGLGALGLLWFTQRPPQTAPFEPMRHSDVNSYGINTFLQLEVEEQNVRRQLELLREAGFGWIRQEFPWEDIEIHGRGDFEDRRTAPHQPAWSKYDRIVALAEEHGIQVLARLDNPPAWSRSAGDARGTLAPPDNFEDFGSFAAAVAGRYCRQIRYYQVWNEPNIYPEWGEQDVDPEAYSELLALAYRRVKAACPDAVVVSAALAQNIEPGGRNMSDLLFLERMYAAGAGDYFDVLGAQAFGLWTGPTDRRASRDRANFSRIELTRDVMVRHGDADKPLWITEMGWAAVPEAIPTVFGRVTREQQARYLADAYRRTANEWPFAGPLFAWFLRRPDWSEQNQDWFYFGLVSPDWERSPAFDALAALASLPPAVPPGLHQEDHPALRYAGAWQTHADPQASLGHYREGGGGAGLEFEFVGSDLVLVSAPGSRAGRVRVVVDHGGARVVEMAAGKATRIAHDLPASRHTVALDVVAGPVTVDTITVRRTCDRLANQVLAAVALVFATGGAITLARHLRPAANRTPGSTADTQLP